jgi:hypothetical protein
MTTWVILLHLLLGFGLQQHQCTAAHNEAQEGLGKSIINKKSTNISLYVRTVSRGGEPYRF